MMINPKISPALKAPSTKPQPESARQKIAENIGKTNFFILVIFEIKVIYFFSFDGSETNITSFIA